MQFGMIFTHEFYNKKAKERKCFSISSLAQITVPILKKRVMKRKREIITSKQKKLVPRYNIITLQFGNL